MKKVVLIITTLVLLGFGCNPGASTPATTTPTADADAAVYARMSGQITLIVDDGSFVILKKSPETGEDTTEKITVTYDEKTRFATPDGSGIGAPTAKPQIEAGLVVDVSGSLQTGLDPYSILTADNIIFNAE